MGFGRYRFRRSFGNVSSQFRGATPKHYPLFSGLLDQYGGAAAAYSLRALSSGWLAGDVVEVRRSSDSTTQDFTASQIDGGAMLDFVNNSTWTSAVNSPTSPYTTFTGTSLSGFSATLSSGVAFGGFGGVSGVSGQTVSVSFDVVINSGSPNLALRTSSTVINTKSNSVAITTSGSYTADLTANAAFGFIGFSEGDAGSDYTISNFEVTAVSGEDGYVSTWYDQSGFANDATQATTTAQPKIVSAGSLVTGGLDFDGVDDRFTSALAHSADISAFLTSTINQDNTSNSERIVYLADGSDSFQITRASTAESFELSSKNTAFQATIAAFRHGVSPIGLNLVTMITSSSATSAFSDGASTTNSAQALGAGGNATTTIGARDDLLASSFFKGQMDEIIIYNSDQSANRVAIEANINDAYSIF